MPLDTAPEDCYTCVHLRVTFARSGDPIEECDQPDCDYAPHMDEPPFSLHDAQRVSGGVTLEQESAIPF